MMSVASMQQVEQTPLWSVDEGNRRFSRLDWLLILFLVLITVGYVARGARLSAPPAEDAAMLMRYATHLAQGHGIVWNIGEKPVDGATDFLFMVMVAGLIGMGLSAEVAVRLLVFLAHVLNVVLVYYALRSLFGATWWLAVVPAFFLAVATGPIYITTCFGAPVFALFASLSWFFALRAILWGSSPANALGFGLFSLITGLVRPEGVILTLLMVVAALILRGWRGAVALVLAWVIFVVGLGAIYFLWRWHYFGYPLPNPFYKKGGGTLHLDGLRDSYTMLRAFSLPFLLLYLGGLLFRETRRLLIGLLIPPVGFATAFILISSEMNLAGRFQYPALPLILMGVYPAAQVLWRQLQPEPRREPLRPAHLYMLFAVLLLLLTYCRQAFYRSSFYPDGRAEVAKSLAQYRSKGYWMAVTEAGLLPFYSGWNAIDTWGLNDQWIAHHGAITEEYLERYRPHLIVFHAYFSPVVPPDPTARRSRRAIQWDQMVATLQRYAERRGYILAAVYGDTPRDTHYYYVRSDFPDAAAIVEQIRNTRYIWYETGTVSVNYALLEPTPGALRAKSK